MKAVLYEEFRGRLTLQKVPDPEPPEHGVVLAVGASGLCLSDWHGWMGHDPDIHLPHVPGHELAGTIVALGKGIRRWELGQRVTVPFVSGCGHCVYCREGNQQVCNHQFQPGFTAWGSFAEYVAISYADTNLIEIPERYDFIETASLGCRFITAYRALADRAQLQSGQWVAVHGCGGVGLSSILIAKALGAQVVAIDITDKKCKRALELGADRAIHAGTTDVVREILEISRGGVHVSIDALGHPDTCLNSINCLRKLGKHLQVGLLPDPNSYPKIPFSKIIANELQILGSHGMPARRYPELFRLLEKGKIDLHQLIADKVALEQVPDLLPKLNVSDRAGITVINMDF